MSNEQLFEFLSNMIGELKDGHVNLSASFDYGRNWSWKEDFPANFSDTLQRKYLGTDYHISSGLKYRILENNIGYIYCGSFEKSFGAGNLDEILFYLAPCNSLIIDVRNNGGGMITSAQTLAARFTNERTLVGYMQHKTGTTHNSFSELRAQYLEPAKGIRWQKKVCVLTNRSTYSAANEFVKYMKTLGATIIGDKTGGGAGMPFSNELPNGWGVRFSACPMYDNHQNSTEFGIEPTIKTDIQSSDFQKQIDTIIETAFSIK
jgi:C-terminal processing protease CtpA/Prc